jgi:hypothetical protein
MTYVTKHRGPSRPVPKEFCCPVHGDFTADADRDAEETLCPAEVNITGKVVACGWMSPWTPRKVPAIRMRRVEAVRGVSEKAEHKGWLDSSNLEEGQDPEEFAADREKVHEELRKERVMQLAREDG